MAGKKLNKSETDLRVGKCYDLRYNSPKAIYHKEWIEYCHQNYGDKSELQYTQYWMSAGEVHENTWKEKLQKQLDPAVNELVKLLGDEDPKVRQRAIDQIFKYTGNDVEKIEAKVDANIVLTWGTSEEDESSII